MHPMTAKRRRPAAHGARIWQQDGPGLRFDTELVVVIGSEEQATLRDPSRNGRTSASSGCLGLRRVIEGWTAG